jgi:hypothetical protein
MENTENTDESESDPETPLKEGEDIVDGSVFNIIRINTKQG